MDVHLWGSIANMCQGIPRVSVYLITVSKWEPLNLLCSETELPSTPGAWTPNCPSGRKDLEARSHSSRDVLGAKRTGNVSYPVAMSFPIEL